MEVGQAAGTGRSENAGEEAKKGNGHESAKDRKKIATPDSINTRLRDIRDPGSSAFAAPPIWSRVFRSLVIQG